MPKSKHLRSIYSYWKMKEITKMMCDAINKQNKINQKLLEDVEREHEQLIKLENKNKALMEKRNKEMGITNWDNVMDKMKQRHNEVCAFVIMVINHFIYLTAHIAFIRIVLILLKGLSHTILRDVQYVDRIIKRKKLKATRFIVKKYNQLYIILLELKNSRKLSFHIFHY